jgi:hypothetical protein
MSPVLGGAAVISDALGFIGTVDPWNTGGLNTVPNGANNLSARRLQGLTAPRAFGHLVIRIGAQSGNIDVGLYRLDSGTTLTRLASLGSTACPAVGVSRLVLVTPILDPLQEYFLAIAADNVVATFATRTSAGGMAYDPLAFDNTRMQYDSTGGGLFPLGASVLLSALAAAPAQSYAIYLEA